MVSQSSLILSLLGSGQSISLHDDHEKGIPPTCECEFIARTKHGYHLF